ncbi:MAG: UDP-N-acetylmuramate dehydrogenase [Anaerolineae bacterium]|nr:UDP-N-acetylmuramate dehydrogenase [Anaerolineae bacterium]
MSEVLEQLARVLGERAKRDEPLAPYTSMRVGGPADLLVACRTADEVVRTARQAQAHGVPWLVLGSGCNVLVADAGVRGLVILNRAEQVRLADDGTVWAETGAQMAALSRQAVERGLGGLEWAAGLPGTVGGAVVGNAGAFGGDVATNLVSAQVLPRDGAAAERPGAWFDFVYRGSRIKALPTHERPVVLAATFQLRPGDPQALRAQAAEIVTWRRTRHPSGATMGSTFKNAPDAHAGRVIEGAGLKGYRIGGVKVSEQHANFFVNTGEATAADVLALMRHVQDIVERQFGIRLEPEVELVGAWGLPNEK